MQFTYQDLNELIKTLLLNKPYFGYILSRLSRKLDTEVEYSAAIHPTKMRLIINPTIFKNFTNHQQKAILEHEILHIGFYHYDRYNLIELEQNYIKQQIFNVAADCAINQLIPYIPKGCITLETVRKYADDKTIKAKQNLEYYYIILLKSKKFQEAMQKYQKLKDMIDKACKQFNESSQNFDSKDKSKFRKLLSEAKRQQQRYEKTHGTSPGEGFSQILPNYDGPLHKDIWKQLIDRTFGEEPVADKEYFYGRPSRRNPESFYYTKHQVESTEVYVGIDSSASISDDELEQFMGYVALGMKRNNCIVTVIVCDTQINDIIKIKNRKQLNNIKISGRGGTDLRAIPKYIQKTAKNPKNSRLILLTDGYTEYDYYNVKTSVVYTETHSKIDEKYIWNSAVIGESDE